ncbi:hypothetical protein EG799_07160 [Aurantiacibacter spongiae]|uniref:DUF3325 domain-containing protein n=2 Tax=Aurantiacibacter spongiae TaxID=2488860 RepID=A0A3N5CYJ0_9SPHN|nr:hypothetical protein EG799_07160 [Aurantiacibacter spongiae]
MALIVTFLLGIGNFAWHRAVLESGHAMMRAVSPGAYRAARTVSLGLEFVLLCAAMLAIADGHLAGLWAYLLYSAINGGAAWLILSRRI